MQVWKTASLLAVVVALGYCAFALAYHQVLLDGGGENDGYLLKIRCLLAGSLPGDVHRPLLYPIVAAAISLLTRDVFLAARLASVLGASLAVAATYQMAARSFGARAGVLASLLLAVNGHFLVVGAQAQTDMLLAGLTTWTLLASVRAIERPHGMRLLLTGAAFGLAYFTRYTAIALLPVALAPCIPPTTSGGTTRVRRVLLILTGGVVALVPHCLLTWAAFGRLLYDETWRSLAWRHFARPDQDLSEIQFTGLGSTLLHDPATMLRNALGEAARFLTDGLPALIVGSDSRNLAGVLVLVPFLVGCLHVVRRARLLTPLVAHCLIYTGLITLTFLPLPRFMTSILPAVCILTAGGARALTGGRRPGVFVALAALLIALPLYHLPARVRAFAAQHALAEIQCVQTLARELPPGSVILSACSILGEYAAPLDCSYVASPGPAEPDLAAAWFANVGDAIRKRPATHVLLGRVSCGERAFAALQAATVPGDLELFRADPEWLVFRVRADPSLIRALAVREEPGTPSRWTLRATLRAGAEDMVAGVVLKCISPTGEQIVLQTQRDKDGFLVVIDAGALVAGEWTLVPYAVDRSRNFQVGPGTRHRFR